MSLQGHHLEPYAPPLTEQPLSLDLRQFTQHLWSFYRGGLTCDPSQEGFRRPWHVRDQPVQGFKVTKYVICHLTQWYCINHL